MAILVYNPEFITYWQGHSFAIEAPAEYIVEKNQAETDLSLLIIEDAFNTIGTLDIIVDGTSIGQVNTVSGLDTVIGKEHPILFDDTLSIASNIDITINYSFISNGTTYSQLRVSGADQKVYYDDIAVYDGDLVSASQSGWSAEALKYITPQNNWDNDLKFNSLIINHFGAYCEYCLPIELSTLAGWSSLTPNFHQLQVKYLEANRKYLVVSCEEPSVTYGDVGIAVRYLFDESISSAFLDGIGHMVISGAKVAIDVTNVTPENLATAKYVLTENDCLYKEYDHPKAKISQEVRIGKGTVFSPGQLYGPFIVSDVVDGDTLKIDFGSSVIQKVRLIGVDTPESVATGTMADKNCLEGVYVSNLTKLLKTTNIWLEFDEAIYDQFNRYLVYLYTSEPSQPGQTNVMYNYKLAIEGHAQAKYYAPNGQYREQLEAAMESAKQDRSGFWGDSETIPGTPFYPTKIPAITDLTINDGIITWTKSVWASSYKIHVGTQDLATVNQPVSGDTVSYDLYDLGLTAGQTYSVKVRAIAAHRHHEDSNLGNQVQFTPVDYASMPLFFTSDQAFTAGYNKSSEITEIDIQYREGETGSWTSWNGTTLNIAANTKLYVKNNTNTLSTNGNYFNFSGNFKTVGGNLNSMIDESVTLPSYSFCKLFYAVTSMESARHLILPWSTVSGYCYNNMFSGCTSLIAGPRLPATTLAVQCYGNMFNGCTALTSSPALPVTTLVGSCYRSMFNGCTSLQTAPSLPATTLAVQCYQSMFQGCISLTQLPALPATTLAAACYLQMFYGCTSLTTCPALPATGNAAAQCYQKMFYGCTSLTQLPALPLTLVSAASYSDMFNGCSNIKLSTTQTGEYQNAYRIPTTGTGTISTQSLDNMFTNTGGTFKGTPTINTTYYTSNTIVE